MQNQKRNIINALETFSKKMKAFSMSSDSNSDIKTTPSQLQPVQEKININFQEETLLLKKQLKEFLEPLSQEIETDEENLSTAYNLFIQIINIQQEQKNSNTHLKDYGISSPLCKKTEYTREDNSRFAFLRLWFIMTNPQAVWIPYIEKEKSSGFYLYFMEKELWTPTAYEKKILQAYNSQI